MASSSIDTQIRITWIFGVENFVATLANSNTSASTTATSTNFVEFVDARSASVSCPREARTHTVRPHATASHERIPSLWRSQPARTIRCRGR
jgi:hypothetical protein